MSPTSNFSKSWLWILFGTITMVHLLGMVYIDIMDVDAAQYASISQEMMKSGEFLQVQHRQADYLDKPPLLFWVTTLSFKTFGVSNFTFRLPSFLFTLLGIFSTFKLGQFYYDRRTGLLASLVLYSSQAYFLFSHDVRTDTILANVLVFGLWQLAIFLRERTILSMTLGALGIGLAMLEKGPIGLMVAIWAVGSEVIYKRDWRALWRWEWLVGLLVIGVTLAPMSFGLFKQFGWGGLEFYYWTQSFGRITGQSKWQDNSTVFYFLHTFLWAFLPWMFLAYYGVGKNILALIKTKFSGSKPREVLTLGGFVITFAALSLSHYKLPHYIFVVFPLVSIITASTVWEIIDSGKGSKVFIVLQWVVLAALWFVVTLLSIFTFPISNWLIITIALIFFLASVYFLVGHKAMVSKLIYSALLTIVGVNFVLDTHFYPTLLNYQAGSVAGKYVVEKQIPVDSIYFYQTITHAFDFYSGSIIKLVDDKFIADSPGIYLYTTEAGKKNLSDKGRKFEVVQVFNSYPVTQLTGSFLNPASRAEVVSKDYLLRVD
jgi:4-amino-4-deoxy-L-arabinose transferase-like glycosyltransferase